MNEQSKIIELKGIGEKTERLFSKIGIETVGDLLRYYPRTYDIYEKPIPISEVQPGKLVAVSGVIGKPQLGGSSKMQIVSVGMKDDTGSMQMIWYRMPYLKTTLKPGNNYIFRGVVKQKQRSLLMEHPEVFYPTDSYLEKLYSMQPIYPLTAGLSNTLILKVMRQGLEYLDLKQDILPKELRMQYQLAEYNYAVKGIHFPKDKESYRFARERLVFDEFLIFILALRKTKEKNEKEKNAFDISLKPELEDFVEGLPFRLTSAQEKVWKMIREELCGEFTMARLIQGDVGSGKTIVAVLALFLVGLNGYQGAIMAPTEVLARQHFESIKKWIQEQCLSLNVEFLSGSMTAKEKREAYARIERGDVQIIVGTHALIQEKVKYHNLALVVTDEQHRFGVRQREGFAKKGNLPHILVMSATPIPRTLAIILYGDLDISVIDELPANRLAIKNCVVDTDYRSKAYRFMQKQVEEGRQCYVICPMVEDSENMDAENVLDYSRILQQELGSDIVVRPLHGKMKQKEKDEIMDSFANNEIQVLVSTTVIEVGINVPNATVIMVENAERFGLAQLHQLRGRVGRGEHQSYCIFMSGTKSKETMKRLDILNKSNDGFFIANEDLRLRGPGDLFGIRQSGLLDFKIGDVFQDAKLLQKANEAANTILKEDKFLEKPEHLALKKCLTEYFAKVSLEETL